MPRKTTRARARAQVDEVVHRPTALSLVKHILVALVNDGMAWLTIPVIAVTAFLYHNHFQNDVMLAVVFCGLMMIALVRGSKDWQRDLNEYQRHMVLEHHKSLREEQTNRKIPEFYSSRPYR